MFVGKTRNLP